MDVDTVGNELTKANVPELGLHMLVILECIYGYYIQDEQQFAGIKIPKFQPKTMKGRKKQRRFYNESISKPNE